MATTIVLEKRPVWKNLVPLFSEFPFALHFRHTIALPTFLRIPNQPRNRISLSTFSALIPVYFIFHRFDGFSNFLNLNFPPNRIIYRNIKISIFSFPCLLKRSFLSLIIRIINVIISKKLINICLIRLQDWYSSSKIFQDRLWISNE